MNSLRRMLDVLTLITPQQPAIEVEEICRRLGYAPASAYRYVRELTEFGLLVRLPGGYALGPRIIQMDRQMRENDPMLRASRELMARLARDTGLSVLLSELYEDTVINIHQEFGLDASQLNFGRGRPMPLFLSATSRVILAHLTPRQLKRVYERHAHDAEVQRLGEGWKGFSREMLRLRKDGYCASRGELDPDKAGLAAPIFDDKQRVIGAISLVGASERIDAFNGTYLSRLVVSAAAEITQRIGRDKREATPAVVTRAAAKSTGRGSRAA